MPPSEFDLIRRYFLDSAIPAPDVHCGIGDDAAIVSVPTGYELVLSMDTLVDGVHFPNGTAAADVGYKSLAVNLSDLAAMGAEPRWVTLSLTLPELDEAWLQAFMSGFNSLAQAHQISLIGGDLTHGPLSITVQAHGLVPEGQALKRDGAKVGDRVYVSGHIGDAALALKHLNQKMTVGSNHQTYLMARLNRPTPRIKVGQALRDIASSAIDISDGLIADLGHVLEASNVGASMSLEKLPLSAAMQDLSFEQAWQLALSGGDDYELCFTVPQEKLTAMKVLSEMDCRLTCIGEINAELGQHWMRVDGSEFLPDSTGYRHF